MPTQRLACWSFFRNYILASGYTGGIFDRPLALLIDHWLEYFQQSSPPSSIKGLLRPYFGVHVHTLLFGYAEPYVGNRCDQHKHRRGLEVFRDTDAFPGYRYWDGERGSPITTYPKYVQRVSSIEESLERSCRIWAYGLVEQSLEILSLSVQLLASTQGWDLDAGYDIEQVRVLSRRDHLVNCAIGLAGFDNELRAPQRVQ